ncbi:MAG: asparagine--tRNA ligase [Clostridia bacterium]|jgi:asparaginyl-tRNA synthetase|nr:asparagine--tRNA ligase [Clostridia bacterium]MDD4275542.1 asparagine--tRNA ligase [Clostridia bacterium]
MKHTDIKEILVNSEKYYDKNLTVCGWIRTIRVSKNVCFIEVNDGTSLRNMQIIIDRDTFKDLANIEKQSVGASLKINGKCVKSFAEKQAVELSASDIEVLGESPADYPLQKKKHSLEYLRTIAHLRARTNTFNAMFRLRAELAQAIHHFFSGRGFTYAHTPILTSSDCEGAGEAFRVTTLNPEQFTGKKSIEEFYKDDFFGCKAGLTVSGQLEGEAMATALGKIYTFGPTFRAENSNTARHAAEFWQIEPEVSFADLYDIIDLARDMIKYLIKDILDNCPEEITFFENFYEPGLKQKLNNIVIQDFEVLEYTKAIELLKASKVVFNYPVEWGCDLQTEHERHITEQIFKKPVFIVNYPKEIKSFYMKQNPDGKTVAATDLLVPGIGEIIGGSQREDSYDKLVARINELHMNMKDYWWYVELRKYGTVPHGGFGLGFERLMMYITGIGNIRDTIPFPRTTGSLQF